MVFIDAKYKSNLYNKFDNSEILKEDHRHDLHQILAYSSFGKTDMKYGILCYPSDKLEFKKTTYINRITETVNTIVICGLPLNKEIINEAKRLLANELNDIERRIDLPNKSLHLAAIGTGEL